MKYLYKGNWFKLKSKKLIKTKISFLFMICLFSVSAQEIDSLKVICPKYIQDNHFVPFVAKAYNLGESTYSNTSLMPVYIDSQIINETSIKLYKGVGSAGFFVDVHTGFQLSISSFQQKVNIEKITESPETLPLTINVNTTLETGKAYLVNDSLTVLNGAILTIMEGALILLGDQANIKIDGNIQCNGSEDYPVLFCGLNSETTWGGIYLSNSSGDTNRFSYTFFTQGGSDESLAFGHSGSQPVVKGDNATAFFNNCFFLDNVGKAIGTNSSVISLKNCVISRCDTGGEFHNSLVTADSCYILTIPDDSSGELDDDNDAFYFYEVHSSGLESSVSNCFLIYGKDDGIDHNAAKLNISNCWIEGFANEGIACSSGNSVSVFNSLFKNCEQGIEAGYGSPSVDVNHCVFLNNDVGIRFGDNYNWGCSGQISVANSISYNNLDNIRNYDVLSGGPVDEGISISYSITNDADYDDQPYCLIAIPIFEANYLLTPESPGVAAANDGLDFGLVNSLTHLPEIIIYDNILIYPNPANNTLFLSLENPVTDKIRISIFSISGGKIFESFFYSQNNLFEIDITSIPNGLYFIISESSKGIMTSKFIKNDSH